jgi:hypothetical protein
MANVAPSVEDEWVRVEVDDGLRAALARVMAPWTMRQLDRVGHAWVIVDEPKEG